MLKKDARTAPGHHGVTGLLHSVVGNSLIFPISCYLPNLLLHSRMLAEFRATGQVWKCTRFQVFWETPGQSVPTPGLSEAIPDLWRWLNDGFFRAKNAVGVGFYAR